MHCMTGKNIVRVMTVVALITAGLAHAAGEEAYQIGPTGLLGTISKTTIKVTKVDKGSPADGKIKVGDEIVGAGGSKFKADVRRELATAIDAAETKEAGGKLSLVLQGNTVVDLQLPVLGAYSTTAPYNCPKSDAIITRAADALLKAGSIDSGACHSGLLGLMATGEKKHIDAVAQAIQNAGWAKPNQAEVDACLAGDKDMGYVGWYWGYNLIALGEYYLLTKDESVLPAIKTYAVALAKGQDAGGLYGHRMATPKRNGRLPGYAQMNQPSLSNFMGMLFAQKCGITDPALTKGIETSYAYFASFIGRGAFNYGVHGPNTGSFNNNGTSGSAAICMALKGDEKGALFFSQLAATSYDGLEVGHASTFFNPLWTPLGANLSGPEVSQQFFRKSLWLQTMYRSWDGSFSRFGGGSKEGAQAGTALLAYCLPRKVLYITGRNADESIWLTGKAATDAVEIIKTDYKSKSNDELMSLAMDHHLPQVRRSAVGALVDRREALSPTWIKFLQEGTSKQKMLAISQYDWWIPIEVRLPRMDDIGIVLRDTSVALDARVAAAGVLAHFGEPAKKFYMDVVKLVAQDRPEDRFGDIDWALGGSISKLAATPFADGLVTDKDVFYKAAIKLARNKRQHVRADGLGMLADMPLEDFHLVADTVVHVIEDKDPTYHSYHSPGGPIVAGVNVLAHLNIKEGLDYALGIMDIESGKGSFKLRAVMDSLAKYGANAKPTLEKLRADETWKGVPANGKLSGNWNKMVKAIEEDRAPKKMITLEEAKQAGLK